MHQLMSKGLLIYTACLLFGAILAFLATVPQHAILAGMAVLVVTAAVLATAIARDFQRMEGERVLQQVEGAREPSRSER